MTDRSIAPRDRQAGAEEKRRQILDAAVRVFARRGFHTSRVGDIAEEAGVAHGLLYHYFSSKDEVLQTVFRENWSELLQRFEQVDASEEPADEKLRGIVKILLRTWRNDPDLVTVMVREVGRSAQLATQVEVIGEGFAVIERVIREGQADGVFRSGLDPRLASWVVRSKFAISCAAGLRAMRTTSSPTCPCWSPRANGFSGRATWPGPCRRPSI